MSTSAAMNEIVIFGIMFLLFALRVPICFAMAWMAIGYMLLTGDIAFTVLVQRMVSSLDSFPLMAIPFFMLTGRLMNSCGATEHIFSFANSVVGRFRGGMGHVTVVSNMIMAGMSGSAVADASGLGVVLLRALESNGYSKKFAAALIGSAAIIGPIIPPSIPFVIFGLVAGDLIIKEADRLQTLLRAEGSTLRLWLSEQEADARSFALDANIRDAIAQLAALAADSNAPAARLAVIFRKLRRSMLLIGTPPLVIATVSSRLRGQTGR